MCQAPASLDLSDRITTDLKGGVWFTAAGDAAIVHMTAEGGATTFVLPDSDQRPTGITMGPRADPWFTVYQDKVGRITKEAMIEQYAVSENSRPSAIVLAPDGNLWFSQSNWNGLGRIGVDGDFEQFDIRAFSHRENLAVGPDDRLWVVGFREVMAVDLDGFDERFAVDGNVDSGPIAAGSDGKMWFLSREPDVLHSITTDGVHDVTALPEGSAPHSIAAAPGGALWLSEPNTNRLMRLGPGGQWSAIDGPDVDGHPGHIAVTTDGTVWFLDSLLNAVVRFEPQQGGRGPG